jgi:phosphopantothenoylcysteine decarboxylase/phosphopantothenate--cysteine ligase
MPEEKTNLEDVNVLLGVTGAVAVYKAVDLASKLITSGARLRTVMTENACKFVTSKSFEAVTNFPVYTNMWTGVGEFNIEHVNLTDWADIVAVVPATANTIGKMANGICDDLLSSILCACWQKPILIAPAMNTNMWNNPAVQQNIKTLLGRGVELIGPEKGRLACGTEGVGRLSEPQDILKRIEQIASKLKHKKGKPAAGG